ncbi:septum site-determining protein Ssd [Arthrobacter sp. NPDC090010]|uniref:septum site-determining protein Ssd n=1 Tax=Arthrobacter sp. NPDC090010 TaxID=3363942 RepID=UPI00381A1CFE
MNGHTAAHPDQHEPPRHWVSAAREPFLLVTAREPLKDAALTAAAAAGVELVVVPTPEEALPRWDRAQAVIVGADVRHLPARRRGVDALLGTDEDEVLWARAAQWGVERVAVLPAALAWLAEFFGGMGSAHDGGQIAGVWGPVGGAGTSTLASWLALHAAESGRGTLLVNTSPWDSGLVHMLSDRSLDGLGWDDLHPASGAISSERLAEALPRVAGFSVLSWSAEGGRQPEGLPELRVLDAARKAFDLVVLDIGSGSLPVVGRWCDSLTICSPLSLNAMARASRGLGGQSLPSAHLVARCPAHQSAEAEELATRLGLEFRGVLPTIRGTARSADEGRLLSTGRSRKVRQVARGVLLALGAVA